MWSAYSIIVCGYQLVFSCVVLGLMLFMLLTLSTQRTGLYNCSRSAVLISDDDDLVFALVESGDTFESIFALGNAGFDDLNYDIIKITKWNQFV